MISFFRKVKRSLSRKSFGSKEYWESRYSRGGNSGSGSYGKLAEFKARVINDFVEKNMIDSVIEFGCGDGNQLLLASYPKYIGLDVSSTVIGQCKRTFEQDRSKSFFLYDGAAFVDNGHVFSADLALSLDVLYHLVEQEVYELYLFHLFSSAKRFVIIYSSNQDIHSNSVAIHERHRKFTDDIARVSKDWQLLDTVENQFKPKAWSDEEGSIADFFIYRRNG